jgi:hypothetical protein
VSKGEKLIIDALQAERAAARKTMISAQSKGNQDQAEKAAQRFSDIEHEIEALSGIRTPLSGFCLAID